MGVLVFNLGPEKIGASEMIREHAEEAGCEISSTPADFRKLVESGGIIETDARRMCGR